jgi:hypothetical protein
VPNNFRIQRGRAAVLTRFRDPADPELLDARRRMREEAFLEAIAKALAKAPPLKADLRQRAIDLLAVHRDRTQ